MSDPLDDPLDEPTAETISGRFLGISYDSEPDAMVLRLRVSAEDVKRALPFIGGRGALSLDKAD